MCKVCCSKNCKNWGLLALRVALAIIFLYTGWGKLASGHDGAVAMFASLGLPGPEFWAYFVGALEFVGALMLLLGVYVRYAAAWLGVIMVVAMLTVHRGGPAMGYFLPLAILGGTCALHCLGAGSWRLVKRECLCKGHEKGETSGCGCGSSGCGACSHGENK